MAAVRPDGAFYSADFREFILPYDRVRTSPSPDDTLLEFLVPACLIVRGAKNGSHFFGNVRKWRHVKVANHGERQVAVLPTHPNLASLK